MNTKAPRFSPEVRERAVRLVQECQTDYASLWGACESIALMLPLFCGVLSSLLTLPFCAVPRTSVARI